MLWSLPLAGLALPQAQKILLPALFSRTDASSSQKNMLIQPDGLQVDTTWEKRKSCVAQKECSVESFPPALVELEFETAVQR